MPDLGLLREAVDQRLKQFAPSPSASQPLPQAIRYAVLAPGKRLRPLLAVASALHFGGQAEDVLEVACALEMVHAASLVLDDMPCMDDAVLRRGRPTTHRVYGEDIAMLASIALLNQAFGVIQQARHLDSEIRLSCIGALSQAIGLEGLTAGQADDLNGSCHFEAEAEAVNYRKTAVLFIAAVEMGAAVAGVRDGRLEVLREFALRCGLAFQIGDDQLDQTSPAVTGKDVFQDLGKPTLMTLLGVEQARSRAQDHIDAAFKALRCLSDAPEKAPLYLFLEAALPHVMTRRLRVQQG